MAKKKVEAAGELSLTPIMNMVLVLIPLMLLNVVFMTINVIEVTMPQRSAGSASSGEPPKRLQLFISQQGFTIVENNVPLPARKDCTPGGPTVCSKEGEYEVETDRHDWLELYNALMEIKMKPDWTDHDQIEIVGDSAVNFGVLVKTMDIARYQRVPASEAENAIKGKPLLSLDELNASTAPLIDQQDENGNTAKMALGMFPVVVLGMPTVSQ